MLYLPLRGEVEMRFSQILRSHKWAALFLCGFIILDFGFLAVPPFAIYDEVVYVPVAYNMMRLMPQP